MLAPTPIYPSARSFGIGDGVIGRALDFHRTTRRETGSKSSARPRDVPRSRKSLRSDDTIELLDRSRNVGLKVHADKGELRLAQLTDWQPWAKKKWINMEQLSANGSGSSPPIRRFASRISFPNDRTPINRFEQKIRVVMHVVEDVYADFEATQDKHFRRGFTFRD